MPTFIKSESILRSKVESDLKHIFGDTSNTEFSSDFNDFMGVEREIMEGCRIESNLPQPKPPE